MPVGNLFFESADDPRGAVPVRLPHDDDAVAGLGDEVDGAIGSRLDADDAQDLHRDYCAALFCDGTLYAASMAQRSLAPSVPCITASRARSRPWPRCSPSNERCAPFFSTT